MRDFGTNQGLKSAGILYVFQALQTAELGQKIYWEKKAIHLAVTKAEQGNPVQNRNTVGCPLCCKHEVCSFSAKAGHWGNLRRRGIRNGIGVNIGIGTYKSEDLQMEKSAGVLYTLPVFSMPEYVQKR